jgi:hypothetical protein
LAALLAKRHAVGTLYALDRCQKRFGILQQRVKDLCGNVSSVQVIPQHKDFLATQPDDYNSVTSILLDPTCSGSGIMDSMRGSTESLDDDDRIQHLSNFQVTCLKHAVSFPNVKRIVYSTCSLHTKENEEVVAQILVDNNDWQLVAPAALESWPRRGLVVEGLSATQAKCLVRVDPREDDTNGFFVCCFERISSARQVKKKKDAGKKENDSSLAKQPKELGIAFYDNQFKKPKAVELPSTTTKRKAIENNLKSDNGSLLKEPVKKKIKASKKQTTTDKSKDAQEEDRPAIPKKILKKLEWKRKQRHAKESRKCGA